MGNNERFSPQLVMRLEGFDSLPSLELPEGYTVRAARPGEESFWVDIINDSLDTVFYITEKTKFHSVNELPFCYILIVNQDSLYHNLG
jgi:hypothetical protein